jgi:hypothetical protein
VPGESDTLRDWHRLFGLLLTDFFTGLPFTVEVERDLSEQQQFLDVVILRRGRGRVTVRLPDGLDDLAYHNLITFKSHHESLDTWAMKELIGHSVAYRKLVSRSPAELLPENRFRLYAVCARFPDKLSALVPWRERQPGVYDCRWGTDEIRVVVAGQLPLAAHNAPLHLFSASPKLVGFGQTAFPPRSGRTSLLLEQLFVRFRGEGFTMAYTMEDFERDVVAKYVNSLSPEERRRVLESLPAGERRRVLESFPPEERLEGLSPEERVAGLSPEQIRQLLDRIPIGKPAGPRKPRRKK